MQKIKAKTITIGVIAVILSACVDGGGESAVSSSNKSQEITLCDTQAQCSAILLTNGISGFRHEIKNAAGETKDHPSDHLKESASRLTVTRWLNYPDYTDPEAETSVDPLAWQYDRLFNYKGSEQTKSATWHPQEKAVGVDKISERGTDVKIGIMDAGLFIRRNKDYASRLQTGMAMYYDYYDKDYEYTDKNGNKRKGIYRYKWYKDYKPLWNTKYQGKMTGYTVDDNVDDHPDGTTSLMAGTEYGIAKKAKIVPYALYGTARLNRGFQLKPVYDHMKKNDVMAINISLDYTTTKPITLATYERELGKDFITQLSDDADKSKDGPIWVWAAGNDKKDTPGILARSPETLPKLEKYWLTVVDVWRSSLNGGEYSLALYPVGGSNKCGNSKRYCLAAVGSGAKYDSSNIDGNKYDDKVAIGTSYASPQVTGGLAVLKQKFPSKTNIELRERLLKTARHTSADGKKLFVGKDDDDNKIEVTIKDKDGNVVDENWVDADGYGGMSDEFGRGIMRLDLATQPVGSSKSLRLYSKKASFDSISTQKSAIYGGQAFGDGLYNGFSQVNTKVFDSMLFAFDYKMSAYVGVYTPPNTDMQLLSPVALKQQTKAPPTSRFAMTNTKHTKNYMGFSYSPSTVPFGGDKGIMATYNIDATSALHATLSPDMANKRTLKTLNMQYAKTLHHTAQQQQKVFYGMHSEKGSIFGTKMGGQFALNGQTNTAYVLYKRTQQNANWQWDFTGVMGISKVSGLSGMLSDLNNLSVSEWSFSTKRQISHNKTFGINIRQPIRVETGTANLVHISKVDKGNALSYATTPTPITPSGRQITLEAYYQNNNLTLKTTHQYNQGHTQGKTEHGIFAYYRVPFK